METPRGRWLGLKVRIATAITIVCDIVDGKLLFGIHDCNRNLWCEVKQGERYAGQEVECSTRPQPEEGGGRGSSYVRGTTLERRKRREEKCGATVFQLRRELGIF